MKIRTTLDVVEIPAGKVDEAIRRLILEETGREMAEIVFVNPVEEVLISAPKRLRVYLNATLKPVPVG
jgi:8-oxo-dGTP pyrophosphatase MutT (NUDIX family)